MDRLRSQAYYSRITGMMGGLALAAAIIAMAATVIYSQDASITGNLVWMIVMWIVFAAFLIAFIKNFITRQSIEIDLKLLDAYIEAQKEKKRKAREERLARYRIRRPQAARPAFVPKLGVATGEKKKEAKDD